MATRQGTATNAQARGSTASAEDDILKIYYQYVNGINENDKQRKIRNQLSNTDYDIVILTGTRLSDNFNYNNLFDPARYRVYSRHRPAPAPPANAPPPPNTTAPGTPTTSSLSTTSSAISPSTTTRTSLPNTDGTPASPNSKGSGGVVIAVSRNIESSAFNAPGYERRATFEDLYINIVVDNVNLLLGGVCVPSNVESLKQTAITQFMQNFDNINANFNGNRIFIAGAFILSDMTWNAVPNAIHMIPTQNDNFVMFLNDHNLRQYNNVPNLSGVILSLILSNEGVRAVNRATPALLAPAAYHPPITVDYSVEEVIVPDIGNVRIE